MMMKTLRRWWWVSALLVMAVGADVSADSLTEEAVRLVREDFHKSNRVKNAFQVVSMLSLDNQEQSDGTFVKVKFTMKQTKCRRHKWMNQDCAPLKATKRTYNCLGCFKFDSNGDLLKTGYQKCVRQSDTKTNEVRSERRKTCAKLRVRTPVYEPGTYNFRRGQYSHIGRYDK